MAKQYGTLRREAVGKIRRTRKQYLIELKGGQCAWCGFKGNSACFDFHHIDYGADKKIDIGTGLQFSEKDFHEKVIPELDKCILLCANCHRMLHSSEISQ